MVELTFTTPAAAHCCLETHGSVLPAGRATR